MSRSFKKNNIVKDNSPVLNHNKRFRRVNKIRIKQDKEPLDDGIITNGYDVCDWRFISENEKDKRK